MIQNEISSQGLALIGMFFPESRSEAQKILKNKSDYYIFVMGEINSGMKMKYIGQTVTVCPTPAQVVVLGKVRVIDQKGYFTDVLLKDLTVC